MREAQFVGFHNQKLDLSASRRSQILFLRFISQLQDARLLVVAGPVRNGRARNGVDEAEIQGHLCQTLVLFGSPSV